MPRITLINQFLNFLKIALERSQLSVVGRNFVIEAERKRKQKGKSESKSHHVESGL